jgi:AraC-like DNA-binding protein
MPSDGFGDMDRLLASRRFSTRGLHRRDQFDAWRDMLAGVVDLLPPGQPALAFPAEAEEWTFGDLRFARYDLTEAPSRAWRHRPNLHSDDWCLVVAWPSGQAGPPAVSFRSLALPFEGKGRDGVVFTLQLPRRGDPREAADLDEAHAGPVPPPMAAVLTDFVVSLAARLPCLTEAQADALAEPTRQLVAACVVPRRERSAEADSPLSSLLLDRARHVVRQNMASPDFGPGQLVRLLAVSRSKLYRVLEPSGGVAAFIQRERLQQARRLLSDPAEMRSVNVIAAEVGFLDHSTFSRAFRREFELSPSEAREVALAHRVTRWQPPAGAAGAAGAAVEA